MTISINDIKKMSVTEKIKLAEKIWQDIPNDSSEITISESDRIELDKRLEKIKSGIYKTLSWQKLEKIHDNRISLRSKIRKGVS